MQNKPFRFGPIALTNAVANLLNPPTATGGVNAGASPQYILLSHMRIVNKTAAPVTVSFWLGATGASAAGTEVVAQGKQVPANDSIDWYAGKPGMRLDSTDFLTGQAGANTSLTVEGEGEIGVSG
jgi:hypothetical protein